MDESELGAALKALAKEPAGSNALEDIKRRACRRRRRYLAFRLAFGGAALLLLVIGAFAVYEVTRPEPTLTITDKDIRETTPSQGLGSNEASWRAAQIRDYFGLWSGNVETIPEKPESLPAEFFEEPQEFPTDAIVLAGSEKGQSLVRRAEDTARPLWLFANELDDLTEAARRVRDASNEARPIVIMGADERTLATLLPASKAVVVFASSVAKERRFVAYANDRFRTSTLMTAFQPSASPTAPLTSEDESFWQLAALSSWTTWPAPEPGSVDLEVPADAVPHNRNPYPADAYPDDPEHRWAWENGAYFSTDDRGREYASLLRTPPGVLRALRMIPPSPDGKPRWGKGEFSIRFETGRVAPDETIAEHEMYRSGEPMAAVPGWDGYDHPVLQKDLSRVVSPAVVPPGETPNSAPETNEATSTSTTTPPTTQANYPVLEKLPPIPLQELALVELRKGGPDPPPLRVLSPAADEDLIARLLSAYTTSKLKPEEGYPVLEQGGLQLFFRLRQGDEIRVDISPAGDRVAISHMVEGVSREGWAMAKVYADAQQLLAYTRALSRVPKAKDITLPAQVPADFGFILAFGVTARNYLDTFAGTFTKDLVFFTPTATTELRLTEEELSEVYRRLRELGIGAYESPFLPAFPGSGGGHTPYTSYLLRVRAAGQEKELRWEDQFDSASPEAHTLRDLFKDIQGMIEAKPEYKALPAPRGAYL